MDSGHPFSVQRILGHTNQERVPPANYLATDVVPFFVHPVYRSAASTGGICYVLGTDRHYIIYIASCNVIYVSIKQTIPNTIFLTMISSPYVYHTPIYYVLFFQM